MQNNTPFSRDPTPDLTRTILSVVKEGQAYSGVERRAKSGPNQRADPSDRRPTGSAETEYNYFKGEYRPRGEQDRYYAKQRAEAKAKKTTTVKEGQAYSGDPPYSGVERRAKSGPNQRNTKGSSRTEYNHFEGEYRPSGEQDRYYAKQRAEAKAKKTTTVKEDIQTPERNAQMTKALIRLGGEHNGTSPAIKKQQKKQVATYSRDRMERQSSNLYDKGGKIIKKKATVKEQQEYTELLETIIVAIANELNISPQTLIEEFSEQELSEGLRKKIMHGLKVATTAAAILGGGVAGGLGMAKMRNDRLKDESPSRQVERQKQEKISKDNWRKATAHQAVPGVDNSSWIN